MFDSEFLSKKLFTLSAFFSKFSKFQQYNGIFDNSRKEKFKNNRGLVNPFESFFFDPLYKTFMYFCYPWS